MNHGGDGVLLEQTAQQRLIPDIALMEMRALRYERTDAGRKIVQNDDLFAALKGGPDHVAADIARSTANQNRHAVPCLGGWGRAISSIERELGALRCFIGAVLPVKAGRHVLPAG